MAIRELTQKTLGKKKSGWHFDKRRQIWVTWQVDTFFNGTRLVRRGFRSESEARDYLAQLKTQERLKELGVVRFIKYPTVRELLDAHFATIENSKGKITARRVFAKFLSVLPKNIALDELRRKHFKDYCDARIAEGVKAESANREITDISAAIHKAGDYFENLENWSVPDNLIYRPVFEASERERIITPDERSRLIEYLLSDKKSGERQKDFIARRRAGLVLYFALLTGLRHGEICALKKTDFDRAASRLRVERKKTRKSGVRWTVFEPLTATQLRVLESAAKLYETGKFFFSAAGKPHNKIYETLRLHCAKLEIPYGKTQENGFVPHDARHTFVTVLEHGAVDSSTTRSFSGHSKDTMLKRYAHATLDSRARAMQIIEREIGAGGSGKAAELKLIFEATAEGKMNFEQFKNAIQSFDGFLT